MAATQTLSQSQLMNDKTRAFRTSDDPPPRKTQTQSPVYIPPSEFRMKLLKRILSVDGTIDNKALKKLQRNSSDRALQANILFQNGDVGTLISFDRLPDETLFRDKSENEDEVIDNKQTLPAVQNNEQEEEEKPKDENKERPLKLPPIVLPPIYSMTPRPLVFRDYSGPPYVPPPVTKEEWEDLQDCRYLRPAMKKFRETNPDKNRLILDCTSYLASVETVRDLLLPAETSVHDKWLPAETVRVILLPAEALGRKQIHADSLGRKPFYEDSSLCRKQEFADSLGGSQDDGQSLQEAKISGIDYTL